MADDWPGVQGKPARGPVVGRPLTPGQPPAPRGGMNNTEVTMAYDTQKPFTVSEACALAELERERLEPFPTPCREHQIGTASPKLARHGRADSR